MRHLAHVAVCALFVCGASMPHLASASVYISEVAWMGSDESQYDEWIELYNDGANTSLSGWTLTWKDGERSAPLSESIGAKSYVVIRRADGGWKGSGLNNNPSGNRIVLHDGSTEIDAVGTEGDEWGGGKNVTGEPKETLQRTGTPPTGAWTTAPPTPGSGSGSSSGNTNTDSTSGGSSTVSKSSGGNTILNPQKKEYTYEVEISCDEFAVAGVPFSCEAEVLKNGKTMKKSPRATWNMGDGTTYTGSAITHAYAYTGTYMLHVSAQYNTEEYLLEDAVHVAAASIALPAVTGRYVEVASTLGAVQDISGHMLLMDGAHFVFPEGTLLPESGAVRFPHVRTGLYEGSVTLAHPSGVVLARHTAAPLSVATSERTAPSTISGTIGSATPLHSAKVAQTQDTQRSNGAQTAAIALEGLEHAQEGVNEVVPSIVPSIDGTIDGTTPAAQNTFWWSMLGLLALLATGALAVFLLRREEEEVIAGFVIESEEEER